MLSERKWVSICLWFLEVSFLMRIGVVLVWLIVLVWWLDCVFIVGFLVCGCISGLCNVIVFYLIEVRENLYLMLFVLRVNFKFV